LQMQKNRVQRVGSASSAAINCTSPNRIALSRAIIARSAAARRGV
jgi:hypothetical protein